MPVCLAQTGSPECKVFLAVEELGVAVGMTPRRAMENPLESLCPKGHVQEAGLGQARANPHNSRTKGI